MRYYTYTDLDGSRHWRRRASRGSTDHAILFFEDDPDRPPIHREDAIRAAYRLMGGVENVDVPLQIEAWERFYKSEDDGVERTFSIKGWVISANTRLAPPARSLRHEQHLKLPVTLRMGDLEETVTPYEEFAVCTETPALMGACPCPQARSYVDGEWRGVTECVRNNLLPAFKVIPAEALLRQRSRSDSWYRDYKFPEIEGFTYISGVYLTDRAGWTSCDISLSEIDPTGIEEAREARSAQSRRAAATRRAVKENCTNCAAQPRCAQGSRVHTCGGTRTPEMLTAALERYALEYDVRRRARGFTEEQITYLMRMGGGTVDGTTYEIRTRAKTVHLGHFGYTNRWSSGGDMVFKVFATARPYDRESRFNSWDELVSVLPSVQENFDSYLPYMKKLPERAYLIYSVIVHREAVERGGFGSIRYLYDVHADDDGVRYKHTAARWTGYQRRMDVEMTDAALVEAAYSYVGNPDVVRG